MVRLQKHLAECGIASRRAAERLIQDGRVELNGKTAQIGDTVEPGCDHVSVDGKPVEPRRKTCVALNKPRGVISSVTDTHGRRTVIDCVTGVKTRVFPVGRLDMDVEGALLLTNDGDLAYRLTHPKFQVDKVYLAWVQGIVNPETAVRLEKGVILDDGVARPAEVVILHSGKWTTLLRITMREGRKREIKRMCEAVRHPVNELQRISVAGVGVKGLRPGEWRYLNESEVKALHKLVADPQDTAEGESKRQTG